MLLFKYKDLLVELVKREIKARYKQSFLGYTWVIVVPLVNLVVMTIVFSFFVRVPTGNIPYPIFLFSALVPWTFTANAIAFATQSLVSNSSLITKIYLPREIFPTATVFAKIIDYFLSFCILIIFVIAYRVPITLYFLFIPVIFLVQLLLVLGLSYILSAINVFFRDIENILSVVITIWMYITPVLYPTELIPTRFIPIFNINPMMAIINSYRNVILYGVSPSWESFSYSAVLSVLIFIFGYLFFKKRSRYFADVI